MIRGVSLRFGAPRGEQYGSRGNAKMNRLHLCPVDDQTSGNLYTWNWKIAEAFEAQLRPIAWSGKGMYRNCCEQSGWGARWAEETMPVLWRRRLAGEPTSTDWPHADVPDMLLIHLGTNDFGHDNGTAFRAAFSAVYTEFVLNATRIYTKPKLPVFLAQGNGPLNGPAAGLDFFRTEILSTYRKSRDLK